MKLTEYLLTEFDREVKRSRHALEQVPEGKYDWKPHEKSMIFGYLADMVATIPSWITMQVTKNELDVAPAASAIKQGAEEDERGADSGARQIRGRGARRAREDHRRAPEHDVAAESARPGRPGGAALRDDPGHDQPLGASSRADDRLSAPDGREGAGDLRTVGGRQEASSRPLSRRVSASTRPSSCRR